MIIGELIKTQEFKDFIVESRVTSLGCIKRNSINDLETIEDYNSQKKDPYDYECQSLFFSSKDGDFRYIGQILNNTIEKSIINMKDLVERAKPRLGFNNRLFNTEGRFYYPELSDDITDISITNDDVYMIRKLERTAQKNGNRYYLGL